jgi:hypothetical protein
MTLVPFLPTIGVFKMKRTLDPPSRDRIAKMKRPTKNLTKQRLANLKRGKDAKRTQGHSTIITAISSTATPSSISRPSIHSSTKPRPLKAVRVVPPAGVMLASKRDRTTIKVGDTVFVKPTAGQSSNPMQGEVVCVHNGFTVRYRDDTVEQHLPKMAVFLQREECQQLMSRSAPVPRPTSSSSTSSSPPKQIVNVVPSTNVGVGMPKDSIRVRSRWISSKPCVNQPRASVSMKAAELKKDHPTCVGPLNFSDYQRNFVLLQRQTVHQKNLIDLKQELKKEVNVIKAGGSITSGTVTHGKVTPNVFTSFENFMMAQLSVRSFKEGGIETNPDKDIRGIEACAHYGVWVPMRNGSDIGARRIRRTADSRRKVGQWYEEKMDPYLRKIVAEYKKACPSSYAYWVSVWEEKKQQCIHVDGFTTDKKCSHYPLPMFVITDRAKTTHIDTNDVSTVKGVTCSVGLVPHKTCCCAGLFLPGCRALLLQNVNELTHVAFRDEAHQYVLQDEASLSLNLCPGFDKSEPCSTYGVAKDSFQGVAKSLCVVLSGHLAIEEAECAEAGLEPVVLPNMVTVRKMGLKRWKDYNDTVHYLYSDLMCSLEAGVDTVSDVVYFEEEMKEFIEHAGEGGVFERDGFDCATEMARLGEVVAGCRDAST